MTEFLDELLLMALYVSRFSAPVAYENFKLGIDSDAGLMRNGTGNL